MKMRCIGPIERAAVGDGLEAAGEPDHRLRRAQHQIAVGLQHAGDVFLGCEGREGNWDFLYA